ncbi:MAG: DUF4294 domain-containing protein [Bacteroidales bacterium]|nr:DUF4294 domain-containing protein [Bacteroidales bacterium]
MLRFFLIAVSLFISILALSQEQDGIIVYGKIVDGDTIAVIPLREVNIFSWKMLDNKEERKLTRLMKNVKIVYPYARLAGIKLVEYEEVLSQAPDDQARRKIMKKLEEELKAEYGQELRDLTVTQGKILLKLIDRETGESSYNLVTEFRGEFRAVFYQAFARLFGLNMKLKYDPEGEDRDIEYIVKMIESGQL